MQTHLNEDDLVLHYYGEMTDAEETRASEHLAACAACHASYRTLQRVLAVVDEASLAGPELHAGFERTVWARLEPNLARDRGGWLRWFALSPVRVAWAAAVVVLVVGSFFAGRLFPRGGGPDAATQAATVRERILLVDLGDHLDRSQMVLVELVSAGGDGSVDISGERARAEQLVTANRLYRQTAVTTGDAAVVDLLDELERVLVDVAASPSTLSGTELADVQRRIESKGLIFKVRVASSDLRERQREAAQQRSGQRSSL